MKNLFASFLLAGGLIVSLAAIAPAQEASTQSSATATSTQNDYNTATDNTYNSGAPDTSNSAPDASSPAPNTSNPNVRTLSGCLQQGAGANEYTLYGYNANSWELVSNSVDLAAHVGQVVEVAYVPRRTNGSNGASRPFIVTDLVMVSSSCSW